MMNIKHLLVGVGGLVLSAAFVMHPLKTLKREEISVTAGQINRTQLDLPSKSTEPLFIWLRGHDIPFRINAKELTPAAVDRIRRGQFAAIGIPKENQGKPNINRFTNTRHYNLATIDIDGKPLYTLEQYNADISSVARVMKWFVPGFAILSLWILYSGIRGGA